MKDKTLTFHDEKKVALTRDTIGQAAMNAAFFIVEHIIEFVCYFSIKIEHLLLDIDHFLTYGKIKPWDRL